MNTARQSVIRVVEAFHTLGFSLIVGSVVYFILGSVARLVGSTMLEWTFCGAVRWFGGPNWCPYTPETGMSVYNEFFHNLLNVSLPWFMIFWGFFFVIVCFFLLKLLGYNYKESKNTGKA